MARSSGMFHNATVGYNGEGYSTLSLDILTLPWGINTTVISSLISW